ncbi:MAG TPA: hypothetical protein VFA78_04600 [Chloroflexota bacterium]|nr:hypothetical protein [Chloroflexota bacterium]
MNRKLYPRPLLATGLAAAMLAGSIFAASGMSVARASSGGYSFTSYAYPHDTFTQLRSVNNAGRIAGYHGAKVNKGFTVTLPGTASNENFPRSAQTQVIGINNLGDTVGFYVDAQGITHGFYRNPRRNKWWTVGVPGTSFNQLLGVNDHGSTAGYYQFGKNNVFQPFTRIAAGAFHLPPIPNAQMTDTNNAGNVTGFQVVSSSSNRAFVVRGSQVIYFQYPGSTFTQALGLNDKGEVVGTYNDKAGTAHGFTYSLATRSFHAINVPGSTSTVVNGVNDHGWIVGFYTAPNKNTVGFLAKPKM